MKKKVSVLVSVNAAGLPKSHGQGETTECTEGIQRFHPGLNPFGTSALTMTGEGLPAYTLETAQPSL